MNSYKSIKIPRFSENQGFYTTKLRSKTMSKIRSKNSKPELALRKAMWALGIRYRIHIKKLPGNPDIVIDKYKLTIFVDGEFWHGHNWDKKRERIKSNRGFWIPKIERNMEKDRMVNEKLRDLGYTVVRFWANDVLINTQRCVNQIQLYIETCRSIKIPEKID